MNLLVILLGLSIQMANAGIGSSGGGNAVVCFDYQTIPERISNSNHPEWGIVRNEDLAHINFIEMVDLYAAKLPRGLDQQPPSLIEFTSDDTISSYLDKIISRFRYTVFEIYDLIENQKKKMPLDQIVMLPHGIGRQIHDVGDLGNLPGPHCVLSTMAISSPSRLGNRLSFDSRLFYHEKHSQISQAILVLHEYLHRFDKDRPRSIDEGIDVNSEKTRLFIQILLEKSGSYTIGDYLEKCITFSFCRQPSHGDLPNVYSKNIMQNILKFIDNVKMEGTEFSPASYVVHKVYPMVKFLSENEKKSESNVDDFTEYLKILQNKFWWSSEKRIMKRFIENSRQIKINVDEIRNEVLSQIRQRFESDLSKIPSSELRSEYEFFIETLLNLYVQTLNKTKFRYYGSEFNLRYDFSRSFDSKLREQILKKWAIKYRLDENDLKNVGLSVLDFGLEKIQP